MKAFYRSKGSGLELRFELVGCLSFSFLGSNAKLLIIKSNAYAGQCRAYESHFHRGLNLKFRFLVALDVVSCLLLL